MSNKEQTIKDAIVRDIAQRLQIPKEKVDAVVLHQFREMNKAMVSGCNSVEMSGFGVFHYLPVKAMRILKDVEKRMAELKANGLWSEEAIATMDIHLAEQKMIKNHLTNAGESKTNS